MTDLPIPSWLNDEELYEEQVTPALTRLGSFSRSCAQAKGFWDKERNDAEMICLMHSELSEALEALRKDKADDHLIFRPGVEVEMADCVIRILDYCYSRDLDLAGAIREKMLYNANRPYKHGKNF